MKAFWNKTAAMALAALLAMAAAGCGGEKDKTAAAKDTLKVGAAGFTAATEPKGPYVIKSRSQEKCILERKETGQKETERKETGRKETERKENGQKETEQKETGRDGQAPYKTVEIVFIEDPGARAQALRKGQIDVAVNVSAGDLQMFKDPAQYRVSEYDSSRTALARLNRNEGRPLRDKALRDALVSALDRQGYCNVLLRGTFRPGGPMLPPAAGSGHDRLVQQDPNRYNMERARKLLKEAGWKDTNGDGFVDKEGRNLELEYVYSSSSGELALLAEATKADARKVGIKVELKPAAPQDIDKILREGAYDLCGSISRAVPEDCPVIVYGYPRTNIVSRVSAANAEVPLSDYSW